MSVAVADRPQMDRDTLRVDGDVHETLPRRRRAAARAAGRLDDFGQAAVPAFHQAEQQGVKVVTDNAIPGNAVVGTDIAAAIEPNFTIGGKLWVQFLTKALHNKGQIVLVGGPSGSLFAPPLSPTSRNR